MPTLHHDGVCPICDNESIRRKKRDTWMYFLPGSKNYYCKTCKSKFVQILNKTWLLKPKNAERLPQLALIAIGALLVLLLVYMFIEHSQQGPSPEQQSMVTEQQ